MEIREDLLTKIMRHFVADLKESVKLLDKNADLINFIETLKEFQKKIYHTRPDSDLGPAIYFDEDEFIRRNFYALFHEKMEPFIKTGLRYYFCKEEHHQDRLFEKLGIHEPNLDWEEYDKLTIFQLNLFDEWLDRLYLIPSIQPLNQNSQVLEDEENSSVPIERFKSNSKEYTRNRQILMLYYMLLSMGIKKGRDVDARPIASFAHVLFGYPIDNIDNSQIYKRLKKAPESSSSIKTQLKDLEFVQSYFSLIEHYQAVELIQEQIEKLRSQKPPVKRTKP